MLTIKTDITNKSWLVYILNEFKKMNIANFDIEVLSLSQETLNTNIIYYTSSKSNVISIYNSGEKTPSSKIEYLRDDLFILQNTSNQNFSINYDLFWNSFVFLSRYEEYLNEKNGKYIYSYSLNHPRDDKNSFNIPIVNILFNDLEDFISKQFIQLSFGDKEKPFIDLSHDVDYINKTLQLRLKQTAFNGFNTIKSILKPKTFWKNSIKTLKFALLNSSYWCFDYWKDLENKNNTKSTFYVYVKTGKKNLKSWLIDPSYDIKTNKKLQLKLKELVEDGFTIGLHGSYDSAKDINKLQQEKEVLEKILNIKVSRTRQHWLNYYESITPYMHNKLFKIDSTVGWNDKIGFRSGCASKYSPYDFKNLKSFEYEIIPQVIMDSNVYDYSKDEDIFNKAKNMIKVSKSVSKKTSISVSWHQRVCSSDYNWHKFYEELLNEI